MMTKMIHKETHTDMKSAGYMRRKNALFRLLNLETYNDKTKILQTQLLSTLAYQSDTKEFNILRRMHSESQQLLI